MKTVGLAFTVLAVGLGVACGGSDHRIGGSESGVNAGGAAGDSHQETGGSAGSTNATGGGPATGGSTGHTGGAGGSGWATGGAPATGGAGGSGGAACSSDADCRLYSYLCTGCDCLALTANQADPSCSGPGVQCLIDPCMDKTAVCHMGSCQFQTSSGCVSRGHETCNTLDDDCDGLVDEGCTACSDITCEPGELCVRKNGGPGYAYACMQNPCHDTPTCECAGALCAPDPHVCTNVTNNLVTCECPQCF